MVKLINNLTNGTKTCIIINNESNKLFDCQKNLLNGTNKIQDGILINNSQNISIWNCIISNFQNGIIRKISTTNEIKNNVCCDNWDKDIISWDSLRYGNNNSAIGVYNFQDIGYNNQTTYQCIGYSPCIQLSNVTLIVYISIVFILIFAGYLIRIKYISIIFAFGLFFMSSLFINVCDFSFFWYVCIVFTFLYATVFLFKK